MSRRSGEDWYVGGMTNWSGRNLEVDFSFLPAGTYDIEKYIDGFESHVLARDFRVEKQSIDNTAKTKVWLASGGGFAFKITPKKSANATIE